MFETITTIIADWGTLGIFLLMLAENLFPPIPSELIMPLGGFLVSQGQMALIPTILAGTAGSVIGTSFWYVVGAWIGEVRLRALAARHGRWLTMSPSDVDRASAWFRTRGGVAVFLGRMVPAVRTLISAPAGVARMPVPAFLMWTTLGSLIWTTVLTVAGLVLASQYQRIEGWIDPLSKAVVLAVVAIYLWRVITWKPQ